METGKSVAWVTGASSGIGLCVTRDLLRDGWQVMALCRSAPEFVHPHLVHVPVDLTQPAALAAAIGSLPDPVALVHAAGVLRVGPVGALDPEDGALMWRLHLGVAEQLLNALASRLPDEGRVIIIGSRTAAGSAGRAQYAASKAALVGFVRSAAIELAPRRICINIVAPGATDTPMLRDPARASVAPKIPPMGRLVTPEEVAGVTTFLLSAAARSITGQQIIVAGGADL